MKGNDGSGDKPRRDLWETPHHLWLNLYQRYKFDFDCCASSENRKTERYSSDFENVDIVWGCA